MPAPSPRLLPVIIFSQFAGTSLWFAGNAIIDQIGSGQDHAGITSLVQFGFIAGTLIFSFFTIVDRFQSSVIFFLSACFAASANLFIIWFGKDAAWLTLLRFTTGFFLAGIYPVGMKIAADFFPEKLGRALGFLVGALVLGTAFPHLVRSQLQGLEWKTVLLITSTLAICGGLLVLIAVPKTAIAKRQQLNLTAAFSVFRSAPFRSAAFGYFGHMWELYAFWSILPLAFLYHNKITDGEGNPYLWSFLVIAAGSVGCVLGGLLSQQFGSKTVAYFSLALSGACCVLAPFFFASGVWFYVLFIVWGVTVTADSPQFSALVAQHTEKKSKGTALSIVTSVGFAITIVSIQWLKQAFETYKENGLWLLAVGPFVGLLWLKKPR